MTPIEKAAQLIVDYQITYRDASYKTALDASVRVCSEIINELQIHEVPKTRIDYWEEVKSIIRRNY